MLISFHSTKEKPALILESGAKDKQSLGRLVNRLARKKHPNLFEVIELIKQEQVATEVQIIQLNGSGQPRPKKCKMQRREDKIKKLTSDFDNGHLTIESFISSLAHLVVNFS